MKQDTPQIVLPTLAYANNMRMDCNAYHCYQAAERIMQQHAEICAAPLQIHHQFLDGDYDTYQVIARHDYGEACIVFIHDSALGMGMLTDNGSGWSAIVGPSAEQQINDWLQQVHEYEGVAR